MVRLLHPDTHFYWADGHLRKQWDHMRIHCCLPRTDIWVYSKGQSSNLKMFFFQYEPWWPWSLSMSLVWKRSILQRWNKSLAGNQCDPPSCTYWLLTLCIVQCLLFMMYPWLHWFFSKLVETGWFTTWHQDLKNSEWIWFENLFPVGGKRGTGALWVSYWKSVLSRDMDKQTLFWIIHAKQVFKKKKNPLFVISTVVAFPRDAALFNVKTDPRTETSWWSLPCAYLYEMRKVTRTSLLGDNHY